jgi:hypothetical protein
VFGPVVMVMCSYIGLLRGFGLSFWRLVVLDVHVVVCVTFLNLWILLALLSIVCHSQCLGSCLLFHYCVLYSLCIHLGTEVLLVFVYPVLWFDRLQPVLHLCVMGVRLLLLFFHSRTPMTQLLHLNA